MKSQQMSDNVLNGYNKTRGMISYLDCEGIDFCQHVNPQLTLTHVSVNFRMRLQGSGSG